jgi:cyclic-di-GMP-binding protein
MRPGPPRTRVAILAPDRGVAGSAKGWVPRMAGDVSFDVVSKLDRQEVTNAVQQTEKEISQRYDFKGTGASITQSKGSDVVTLKANSDARVLAVLDAFQTRLIKRGVSLKAITAGEPKLSGKDYVLEVALKEGLEQEIAKKISKVIRDDGPKGVKVQVVGDELRVSGKNRDDLQAVIALLKGRDFDVALQFINYR